MSTTTTAAALMMTWVSVAEFPSWYDGARWQSPVPATPGTPVIVPSNTCPIPGTEPTAGGRRCVPDCRVGACKRIRVAESQTIYRNERGQTTGSATPSGDGSVTYRDSSGKTIGRSSTDSSGNTRYWDSSGRSIGTSSGPARAPFPGR
jgi:hypothetical protein